MKPTVILHENILSKMHLADRKKLGRAGRTQKEIAAANYVKSERRIHDQFIAFLKRNNYPYCHSDPTKKSSIAAGYPDFQVTRGNRSIYIEFKVPPNQLTAVQVSYINFLIENHNTVHVVPETHPGAALQRASDIIVEFFGYK